jgi:peptidoglycan/xylan/chitin deacetylase (PgdA/CDA1 family)
MAIGQKKSYLRKVRARAFEWLVISQMLMGTLATTILPNVDDAARSRTAPDITSKHPRLIALTFDDGPKPFVLMGTKPQDRVSSRSLLGLLDREGVKATFFVMGWRLADSANRFCREIDVGVNCRQAAEEEHRRGHEIENHTYGHGDFRRMKKRYGEEWILNDIDKASRVIQSVTGEKPKYLRPPDWSIWKELQDRIESRGYHVMTRTPGNGQNAARLQDVDSEDYLFWRDKSSAELSLHKYILSRIGQREQKGVYEHILVFHELPQSVNVLSTLIPELKTRGYTFVVLRKYMEAINYESK